MALLTGLTQDGLEVPVQVDATGKLVAEGLDGPIGPVGPAGPACTASCTRRASDVDPSPVSLESQGETPSAAD